jgi:hypothetical protein
VLRAQFYLGLSIITIGNALFHPRVVKDDISILGRRGSLQ